MRPVLSALVLLLALPLPASAQAQDKSSMTKDLHALFDAEWERSLRGEATVRLGDPFDIRAFHDVVLGSGAIQLDVLEGHVKRGIDDKARSAQGKP